MRSSRSFSDLNQTQKIDVAIIGAGLTGLATANLLHQAGRHVRIFEAASEIGGRIRAFRDPVSGAVLGDRGPTWVWPEFQPTVAQWMGRLNVRSFEQFSAGNSIVETSQDEPPRAMLLPAQQGSVRIVGGTISLVERLVSRLPNDVISKDARLLSVQLNEPGIDLSFESQRVLANQVVIAIPPRIAVNSIAWQPALSTNLARSLNGLPTWMAPHAKAVIVYKDPFWRRRGLSGRVVSRVGPLMEVHDHCSANNEIAALFGFVGWPSPMRTQHKDQLPSLIERQLVGCFGEEAAAPEDIMIEDWSDNDLITHPQDLTGPQNHPNVAPAIVRQSIWGNKLVFASAELAGQSPGLIDGAFVAAELAAHTLGNQASTLDASCPNQDADLGVDRLGTRFE